MDRVLVSATPSVRPPFRDGLGERRRLVNPARYDVLEQLFLKDELAAMPSFEFAVRERVNRLAEFRHEQFARVHSVERAVDRASSTLAVVSERVNGVRLSDLLQCAEQRGLALHVGASLCLIKQLVHGLAVLHESAREVAHGAISLERLVVTPDGRLMIVEYVFGSALERLRYSRERYWSELRVALPASAGLAPVDQRADATQIGVVALSLILGRPIRDDEYPARIADVLASAWAVLPMGGFAPLPIALRTWIGRALQLDSRTGFDSASQARTQLKLVLPELGDYSASPATLSAFLARYHGAETSPLGRQPPVSVDAPICPAPAASDRPLALSAPMVTVSTARAVAATPTTPEDTAAVAAMSDATPPFGTVFPSFAPVRAQTSMAGTLPASADALTPPLGIPIRLLASPQPTPIPVTKPKGPALISSSPKTTTFGGPAVAPLRLQPMTRSAAATVPAWIREPSVPFSARRPPTPTKPPRYALSPAVGGIVSGGREGRTWPRLTAIAGALLVLLLIVAFVGWAFFQPEPAAVTDGTLVLTTNPSGAQAIVDGRPRGVTPLTLRLSAGHHQLELRSPGGSRAIRVTIAAGMQFAQFIELPQAPSGNGQLRIRTEPPGARVTVDGMARGTSPLTVSELPPGEHQVLLESDFGSVKETVTIESGATAQLLAPMRAPQGAPVSGWIAVSSPLELQLFEGNRLLGSSRSDRIMVAAGRHDIDLVSEAYGYRATRTVHVAAGKLLTIATEMPRGSVALTATPWAEVWIDGARVGQTPISDHPLTLGDHQVVFRHPELGEQTHTAVVTLKEVARLSVDMRQK